MAQLIADRRDIDFVLYDQLGIEALFKTERYRSFNPRTGTYTGYDGVKYFCQPN